MRDLLDERKVVHLEVQVDKRPEDMTSLMKTPKVNRCRGSFTTIAA